MSVKIYVSIPKSRYSLTFYPTLVVISDNNLEIASIEVKAGKPLYDDRDLLIFAKLPGTERYLVERNRIIHVSRSLEEVVGYHDQLVTLKKSPPSSLHNADPTQVYAGGSWVIIMRSEVPISHYRLVR